MGTRKSTRVYGWQDSHWVNGSDLPALWALASGLWVCCRVVDKKITTKSSSYSIDFSLQFNDLDFSSLKSLSIRNLWPSLGNFLLMSLFLAKVFVLFWVIKTFEFIVMFC